MKSFLTNDNVNINYSIQGEGNPILFVPGWSCSYRFFDKNMSVLSKTNTVVGIDFRGHGMSDKPDHGYRISRFAKDVQELLAHLNLTNVTAVGWSMGAAVLWSYLELFGNDRISKLVCVDQSPAQYIGPDWKWGQNGCYDVEAFVRLCGDLTYAERDVAEGTVQACNLHQLDRKDAQFLVDEIMKSPARVKIEIMRDHTNLDWRDFLPYISIPTMVTVARNSAVFPWEGSAYVAKKVPNSRLEMFEDSGHMLFWEEAEKFNYLIDEFVNSTR